MLDQGTQGAVLALVLAEYPTLLTQDDLAKEVGDPDAVALAVRDLIAVGLLRHEGGSVLATRAALTFDRLSA